MHLHREVVGIGEKNVEVEGSHSKKDTCVLEKAKRCPFQAQMFSLLHSAM